MLLQSVWRLIADRLGDQQKGSPEPLTEAYPEYGKGGAVQLYADGQVIKYDKVEILPESANSKKTKTTFEKNKSSETGGNQLDDKSEE